MSDGAMQLLGRQRSSIGSIRTRLRTISMELIFVLLAVQGGG